MEKSEKLKNNINQLSISLLNQETIDLLQKIQRKRKTLNYNGVIIPRW